LQSRPALAKTRPNELIQRIQAEVHPLEKNLFRSGNQIGRSLQALENVWDEVREGLQVDEHNPLKAREIAAMAATARWCYSAAQQRRESRGMHQRSDTPEQSPLFDAHLRIAGVDQPWTRLDAVPAPITPPPQGHAQ
jgi:succinate dehydrogenase/fumarate reductase flavoprotein subunit